METNLSPVQIWLHAIRPKTLFASVSPILVGTAVAYHEDGMHWPTAIVALLVAVLLQITSNLANDYFDHKKGADKNRVGPLRVMNAGLVSERQMQLAIAITIGLSLLGAIIYEVMKRREEAQAERDKENAKLAERSDLGEAGAAGLK